jgi:hypothetical protein
MITTHAGKTPQASFPSDPEGELTARAPAATTRAATCGPRPSISCCRFAAIALTHDPAAFAACDRGTCASETAHTHSTSPNWALISSHSDVHSSHSDVHSSHSDVHSSHSDVHSSHGDVHSSDRDVHSSHSDVHSSHSDVHSSHSDVHSSHSDIHSSHSDIHSSHSDVHSSHSDVHSSHSDVHSSHSACLCLQRADSTESAASDSRFRVVTTSLTASGRQGFMRLGTTPAASSQQES